MTKQMKDVLTGLATYAIFIAVFAAMLIEATS